MNPLFIENQKQITSDSKALHKQLFKYLQQQINQQTNKMGFEVCGPNEAMVVSGTIRFLYLLTLSIFLFSTLVNIPKRVKLRNSFFKV